MLQIEAALVGFGDLAWGPWLLLLLVGGGFYFLILSRLLPFRYLGHSIALLSGKYDQDGPGEITHFQALSSALAGTIGMGNIAGVAVAISIAGQALSSGCGPRLFSVLPSSSLPAPSALCTAARTAPGRFRAGPCMSLRRGLGQNPPPGELFCIAGTIGCLPLFQTNQLVQAVREIIFLQQGWITSGQTNLFNLLMGLTLACLAASVIFGGLARIARVVSKLVPTMAVIYVLAALYILATHITEVPALLLLIVTDAFTGNAATGGLVGAVIVTGIRRGVFSNEAGIGTDPWPMAPHAPPSQSARVSWPCLARL